jgi:hypothetical protein
MKLDKNVKKDASPGRKFPCGMTHRKLRIIRMQRYFLISETV